MSSSGKSPFSKASMAQAMVPPAEIVSMPSSLQTRPALQVAARSIEPMRVPKETIVSYSGPGPSGTAKGPSLTSTTRLQAIPQKAQAPRFVRYISLRVLPAKASAASSQKLDVQFFTGTSPLYTPPVRFAAVPSVCSRVAGNASMIFLLRSLRNAS